MLRYVLMTNDYPHQLLPAGWTEEQAEAFCAQLTEHEEDRLRSARDRRIPALS